MDAGLVCGADGRAVYLKRFWKEPLSSRSFSLFLLLYLGNTALTVSKK